MKPTIFLDMDEVLTDFIGSACQIHSRDPEEVKTNWPPELWDICQVLGIPENEFWFLINYSGESFWMNLQKTPWFHSLINLVESVAEEWYIVTSPTMNPGCYSGKVKRIQRAFGHEFDRLIITRHKRLLAKPNIVLIDDRVSNVQHFVSSGGQGILFPACHNVLHAVSDNPIPHVQSRLEELCNALPIS